VAPSLRSATTAALVFVFAFLTLASLGCATSAKTGTPLDDPVKRAALIHTIESRYPEHFRAIHRATLSVRGRDFALDGFLRIHGDEFQFLASTGFGTVFFEIASGPPNGDVVVRSDDLLPTNLILAGPAQDIRAIYLRTPTPSAALSVLPGGLMALTDIAPDGSRAVFTLDALTGHWLTYTHGHRGRPDRMLRFDDFSAPDQNGNSFPRRIQITNSALHYKVDIRVATVVPEP